METYAALYFRLARETRDKAETAADVQERLRLLRVATAYEEAARTFEICPEAA